MEENNELYDPKPWLWKKGKSANPLGRPKGVTLKEYARRFLARMTDEERDEFMNGLDKEVIWKMAEGNPHNTEDSFSRVAVKVIPIYGGKSISEHNGDKENILPQATD